MSALEDNDEELEEEEDVEPGQMRVSEIKAELKLRAVNFDDCFDKDSLAHRLREARCTGKADPSILEDFKETQRLNKEDGISVSEEDMARVVGGDGTLPGGMPPDMLKSLTSNPEIMSLLQTDKMQEVMRIMMTDGQSALELRMAEDVDIRNMVIKLNEIMGASM